MVHGLETIDAINAAAARRQSKQPFQLADVQAVADVRFVMCPESCEALYIDGELIETETAAWTISIDWLASHLDGRAAMITSVTLSDDWPSENDWPERFSELAPYIETESPQ